MVEIIPEFRTLPLQSPFYAPMLSLPLPGRLRPPHPIPILSVHLPPAYSNQTEPTTRRHFPRVQFYLLSVDCCPEYLSNVVVCRFRRVRTAASKHICPCCFHQMKAILSARSRILPQASASCSIWIRNFDSLAPLLSWVTWLHTKQMLLLPVSQMGEKLHMPAIIHPSLFLFSRNRALLLVIINVVALGGGGGGDDISPTIKRDTSLRSGISRHCCAAPARSLAAATIPPLKRVPLIRGGITNRNCQGPHPAIRERSPSSW